MDLITILNQIGLNKKEASIYIAMLQLGESNLNNIAEKAKMPRTTVYTPLKSLIEKNYVEFYKKKGRKYYIANPPEKIIQISEEKINDFRTNLNKFKQLEKPMDRPDIKFFQGTEGLKIIFNEILNEKRSILAITSIEDMHKIANEYFEDFIEKRIDQNLNVKLLTNKESESLQLKKEDHNALRETKFVPEKYHFNTANYIFGDTVAILSLRQEPIIGILIKDSAIAKTHRMYFELIWQVAK